jgi:hypothetical protein
MSTTASDGRMPKLPKNCFKSTSCTGFVILASVFIVAVGVGMVTNGANGQDEGLTNYQTPVPSLTPAQH